MATLYFPETGRYSGVGIDYRGNSKSLTIYAWKQDEHIVQPERISLNDFLTKLEIKKEDLSEYLSKNK